MGFKVIDLLIVVVVFIVMISVYVYNVLLVCLVQLSLVQCQSLSFMYGICGVLFLQDVWINFEVICNVLFEQVVFDVVVGFVEVVVVVFWIIDVGGVVYGGNGDDIVDDVCIIFCIDEVVDIVGGQLFVCSGVDVLFIGVFMFNVICMDDGDGFDIFFLLFDFEFQFDFELEFEFEFDLMLVLLVIGYDVLVVDCVDYVWDMFFIFSIFDDLVIVIVEDYCVVFDLVYGLFNDFWVIGIWVMVFLFNEGIDGWIFYFGFFNGL